MAGSVIAVIGGGPAGLFCAIHAAVPGCHVLLFEKNARPGAKLLLAGSGQCNITHAGDIRDFLPHYGSHGKFVRPALMQFTNQDLIRFFTERGLPMEAGLDGKIFPRTRSSADVLDHLLREVHARGVEIRCDEPATGIERGPEGYVVSTGKDTYVVRAVVLATGGASYPKTGSTGDGYVLATSLGQPVTELSPALTPVIIRDYPFGDLAGISFEQVPFTLWRDGKKVKSFRGDVLFTHTGLSGPGILDASRDLRAGDILRFSFSGTVFRDVFSHELTELVRTNGPRKVRTALAGLPLPDRLLHRLMDLSGIPNDLTCAHLTAAQRSQLVIHCTEFSLIIERLGDFSIAMATRGGIALDQVNSKTLESKTVPGLFFAGEVLDIDGDTGGYNLQAAFSTGYCAAMGIRKQRENPS